MSSGAAQYDVAFGTTNPPAIVSSNQAATSYQPIALTPGVTYYWRIVAKNIIGSTSGPVWSLTAALPGSLVPVAAYAFNEGTGATTADRSGNALTGVLSNTTWTTAGKYNGALSFNGSSSSVTVADALALHVTNAMTVEAWVNPAATGTPTWQAVIQGNGFFISTDGSVTPTAGVIIGGVLTRVTSPNDISANAWTHLAMTYDDTMPALLTAPS